MKAEDIREVMKREPFEPVTVVSKDGQSVDVMQPGDAWVSPGSGLLYIRQQSSGLYTFSEEEVLSVEPWVPPSRRNAG